ncbi:MAG: hypothetical protein M3O31_17470 [Acidobacteriota bacterium]|nr:hypothetical protein [Acidobacteriota bacterium]
MNRLASGRVTAALVVLAVAGGLASGIACSAGSEPMSVAPMVANSSDCNRRCLLGLLTEFTEALTDNDVSKLPLAPDVRATSNGVPKKVGQGEVWGSAARLPFRRAFVDPLSGSAVFYSTVTNTPTRDGARWWFYMVRLAVVGHKITEVEEISYDGSLGGTPASTLSLPDRVFDTYLPQSERISREQLMEVANRYFDAVSHSVDYHSVPWHPECQRIELGVFTVNAVMNPGSCGGEFKNPAIKWNVKNRRFYIADPERGVVLAIGNFTTPPDYPHNNGSVVFEVFKVQDGMIRQIEAFFRGNGQPHSGWGTGP